jgi:hypothetical protein
VTWSATPSGSEQQLYATAALTPTNAWAVGGGGGGGVTGGWPEIEHWDGTAWRLIDNPATQSGYGWFAAVTRVPKTTQVWAVGQHAAGFGHRTLIERWNGTAWVVIRVLTQPRWPMRTTT